MVIANKTMNPTSQRQMKKKFDVHVRDTLNLIKTRATNPGFHCGPDESPWVQLAPGTWNKYTLFDLPNNAYVNLFKINPGCSLAPHYHCQPVIGYVIEGKWKYKENSWVAGPGSTVYESAGTVHTLTNVGAVPMISVFHVTGPSIDVDDAGRQVCYADAYSLHQIIRDYCKLNGINSSFLKKITRT